MIAHGFPPGEGVAVGLESERRVREAGATPATIGVLDGEVRVGLDEQELERFGATARKLGPRDVAAAVAQRAVGATTVGGTLAVARTVGLRFMGTGGIGGVHRGWTQRPDVSSDLGELARTRVVVVASGAKSILDVPATAEALETLGIPTLGFRTDTLPLFYAADGGPPVSARVESPSEVAEIASAHWELGGAGLLVGNPPAQSLDDVEGLIEQALEEAGREGVGGQGTDAVRALVAAPRERRANARGEPRARRGQRGLGSRDRSGGDEEMKWVLALPLVVAVSGASPLPGLPSYTAGYTSWTKLNSKPIPRRAVDAHSSIKNVYASKLPRAGRYPVGAVIVKEGRQRAGAPVTLIAVMRKLSATGPHNGWQMIEWTRPSRSARFTELARGQVCTSCHFQARKTDYVFTKRR